MGDTPVVHVNRFQSTHPSGVRPDGCRVRVAADLISIHAPQWGATFLTNFSPFSEVFQSTHPSGVRLKSKIDTTATELFQSTHPSGVRRLRPVLHTVHGRISIHAPQWGATLRLSTNRRVISISIHAPQWGATYLTIRWKRKPADFNPRTPVGCDHVIRLAPRVRHVISIHAPQWGATCVPASTPGAGRNFNPRTPVGCDLRFAVFRQVGVSCLVMYFFRV